MVKRLLTIWKLANLRYWIQTTYLLGIYWCLGIYCIMKLWYQRSEFVHWYQVPYGTFTSKILPILENVYFDIEAPWKEDTLILKVLLRYWSTQISKFFRYQRFFFDIWLLRYHWFFDIGIQKYIQILMFCASMSTRILSEGFTKNWPG
jgi:hypothetical protein